MDPIDKDILNEFKSRRSVVYSQHGMIACSQPLACQAGLKIFEKSGNAADVAVAVAAALNVTEPCSCGIGGDCFILYYDASTRKISAFNGSGKSPKNLTLSKVREMKIEGTRIPSTNLNSVTVPGAVDAFIQLKDRFGSSHLSLKDLFAPAIELAEQGYPVSDLTAYHWNKWQDFIKKASANSDEILLDGRAPRAGQRMTMKTLAATFRQIGEHGRHGFYRGRVAQSIVDLIQSHGGLMTLEDLDEHRTLMVEPIRVSYKDYDLWECPPNGQGLVALMALEIIKLLERQGRIRPLNSYAHNSSEYIHILIESLRLAFADGSYFICDPERSCLSFDELLSEEYLLERAAQFRVDRINEHLEHGNPRDSSDTVYFSVSDEQGNACSLIFSNYEAFGTGAVPQQCGFTLQNRGSNFTLVDDHPNCIDGGKRCYHTIIPSMITKRNGDLFACFGVMGGFMQPQGHLQVFLNLVDHHKNVQTALDLPRFCITAKSIENDDRQGRSEVLIEDGFDEETIIALGQLGHKVKSVRGVDRSIFGRGQIIVRLVGGANDDSLVWAAGSDPRADGHAVPFF